MNYEKNIYSRFSHINYNNLCNNIPWHYSSKVVLPPAPYETIIADGEDKTHHIKKQEWIEEMHRTAPEDHWRYM